jgi:teichuronic acid biosynthesis glycosyltransferase TuaH
MNQINLVVVPFHDWKKCEREGFRTRDAHFMMQFGKHHLINKVLVINRPISLSEIILLRRNWRVKGGELLLHQNGFYLTQVAEKTFTLDIVIPEIVQPVVMREKWTPYIFGKNKIAADVKKALEYLHIQDLYALLAFEPLFVPLVKQLSPKVFILDAVDNILKHPKYHNMKGLQSYYDYCLKHADLVYANSFDTTKWFKETRPEALYIPNGVDNERFNPANHYSLPEDIKSIRRPIVGYAGKMQELFDVELLLAVANALPEVSFVCIGQQINPKWTKPLWTCPNIHYLGDKHYDSLPHYLASFDICMIPANVFRQHGGDPIKFYEYLAMGKPIVTTNIGGVSAFCNHPQVKVVEDAAQFIAAVKHFKTNIETGVKLPFADLPKEALWSTKTDQIIRDIQQKYPDKPELNQLILE